MFLRNLFPQETAFRFCNGSGPLVNIRVGIDLLNRVCEAVPLLSLQAKAMKKFEKTGALALVSLCGGLLAMRSLAKIRALAHRFEVHP